LSIIQVGNMTIKQLIQELQGLNDPDAIVDMASDEEGNSFGDISKHMGKEELKNGKTVYTLYPENEEMPENRYKI